MLCRKEDVSNSDFIGAFFPEPKVGESIYTPANIAGMYRKLLKAYFSNTLYSSMKITPAINSELEPNHGNPLIVLKRGSLTPTGTGVKGGKEKITSDFPVGIPGSEKFSNLDSKKYYHLQNLEIEVTVYSDTLAECENISYLAHRMFLGYGQDVLANYTDGIKLVSDPTTSEVVPSKKYKDRYESYINFTVTYLDETILLITKNMLEYVRITVSEDSSVDVIQSDVRVN